MFVKGRTQEPALTYWGSMRTLTNEGPYCAKVMRMRAGTQSSMEYHVDKQETYVILRGHLTVGLRTGRAINRTVQLHPGEVFTIFPGQMHMRIARTDVLILEVSTHDDQFDTHIVEDGKTYEHMEGKQ